MNKFKEIRAELPAYGLDGIMLTGAPCRRYATGFSSSAGIALVTAAENYFITDGRYIEAAGESIPDAEIKLIPPGVKYTQLVNEIIEKHDIQRLGFEDARVSYREYSGYSQNLRAELIPAQELMNSLRAVKTVEELAAMKSAQIITDKVFDELLNIISPRMSEKELAAEIIYRLRKGGAENISFDPIVVSGVNSSRPHGAPRDTQLSGFITMDFGCVWDGYCSDMTRTVALGEVTDEMRRVYETVLSAQLAGIAAAKGGALGKVVDGAARDVIAASGFGEYFSHGFGHGLGIEVHEGPVASPSESRELPTGAVISAEPGIYIPGKFGVRIEDVIALTENGSINLTKSAKELITL